MYIIDIAEAEKITRTRLQDFRLCYSKQILGVSTPLDGIVFKKNSRALKIQTCMQMRCFSKLPVSFQ